MVDVEEIKIALEVSGTQNLVIFPNGRGYAITQWGATPFRNSAEIAAWVRKHQPAANASPLQERG